MPGCHLNLTPYHIYRGGFHDGGSGLDQFSRLTATIKDNESKRLYFYRTTDGTFWDRIHIPEDPNHQSGKIYVPITEEQFNKYGIPIFKSLAMH
jgi:hypothetical protein